MSKSVILITGASSGIGYQVSILLSQRGNKVYGAARHLNKMKSLENYNVKPLKLDVTNPASCKNCINYIIKNDHKIDVLLNCAGYGSFGPLEEVPISEAQQQLNVNVLGTARMMKLVLPIMRKHKSGKILNISSMAGKIPIHFGDWYNASKYAVVALSLDSRMGLAKFGVQISVIEPGAIRTPWSDKATTHLMETIKGTAYESEAPKVLQELENQNTTHSKAMSPKLIAKKIYNIINKPKIKPQYIIGNDARQLIVLHHFLGDRIFMKLEDKLLN